MKIAIGADHRGFAFKECIKKHGITKDDQAVEWVDVGTFDDSYCDYPVFAHLVVQQLIEKKVDRGLLLCGSGIGMGIVANRYPGIYAGVVWNEEIAQISYEHDKINVLVIPSDFVTCPLAVIMVRRWLDASFLGGRHEERIVLIDYLTDHIVRH